MITRHNEAEAALDRALSRTPTPQVPPGLSARIVADVTRLPQDAPGLIRSDTSHSPEAPRSRLATGFAVAAVLAIGLLGTALITRSGERGMPPPDRMLAADVSPASAPTAPPLGSQSPALAEAALDVPSATSAPGNRNRQATQIDPQNIASERPESVSHASKALAVRQSVTAPATPQAPTGQQQPVELAHKDNPAETPTIGPVDSSASPAPVYGPPAAQGLGVAGGKLNPPATQGPPRSEPSHAGPGGSTGGPNRPW
ncbi:hypothetical protein [Altererythrobacter fulvus]|uniref:hypothetical protein n=1 Tax=Caenibius fulvus TaxID=2126012 RepID=UPI00301B2C98